MGARDFHVSHEILSIMTYDCKPPFYFTDAQWGWPIYLQDWVVLGVNVGKLGGGFKHFLFSSLFGEMIQFDEHIFQMGGKNHQLENIRTSPIEHLGWVGFFILFPTLNIWATLILRN